MRFRKIASFVTIALLLASIFPVSVYPNVTQSQYFREPIKNWSFEERGSSVYSVLNWSSNNGGWRNLKGDVNGDGTSDLLDLVLIQIAFGSRPGDPDWNPDADLNGDNIVDLLDLTICAGDFGKPANNLDGFYSWYTNGGGNYQMWQWLDSNTILAVAGQNITFSYWFLPASLNSGQQLSPDEGHHWYPNILLVRTLTCTPPSGISVHLTKIKFDTYVTGGIGHYTTEYQKGDDWEHAVVIHEGTITNTAYETKEHTCDVWGNPGESLTVKFYIGADGGHRVYYKKFYMYYDLPVPSQAKIYYEYTGGNNTICGDLITPTENKWYNAFVTASLPLTTTAVRVITYGGFDFKAYVDLASLSIYECITANSQRGSLSLAVNLFRWEIEDAYPGFPDGKALISAGLYAERGGPYDEYRIHSIQLTVELLPNDGSSSTQQGGLQIWYCEQANDHGYEVDPAAAEEFQNQVFSAGSLAIKTLA